GSSATEGNNGNVGNGNGDDAAAAGLGRLLEGDSAAQGGVEDRDADRIGLSVDVVPGRQVQGNGLAPDGEGFVDGGGNGVDADRKRAADGEHRHVLQGHADGNLARHAR